MHNYRHGHALSLSDDWQAQARAKRAQAVTAIPIPVAAAAAAPPAADVTTDAGRLHKKAKSLPDAKGRRTSEHPAGQDVHLPPIPIRTFASGEGTGAGAGTPPRLENLNIRDGSTTPMVTTDVGSPSPLTPKSRKRTFPDNGHLDKSPQPNLSPQNTRFNPDLEDGSHRIYSGAQRYSIYDYNSRAMSMARIRDPIKGAPAQILTPAQTEPSSPASTTETATLAQYKMLLQPETRPISEEQLINEVRGIYAGLVMVEKKCVEIDQQQATKKTELSNEQWQALIALHRTLLHEHHDFFLASQHPSASLALRKLASKYAMPARMWRHGIHSLLELLRHRLPDALEHMLAFICTAYSMMALLVESVPDFEDTWIECLGDLARYRMAIEEADIRDREVWAGVARYWYNKAANKSPNVGRIQHHLAVLARPNILQQLFFYTKSLVCVQAFPNTQDSIQLLFNPILKPGPGQEKPSHAPMVTSFVKTHGILFGQDSVEFFVKSGNEFMTLLSSHIGRVGSKFREQGVFLASANFAAMLGYGKEGGFFMQLFNKGAHELLTPDITNSIRGRWTSTPLPTLPLDGCGLTEASSFQSFRYASYFSFHVLSFILRHTGNKNVVPHVHTSLVFLYSLVLNPQIMTQVEMEVPWQELVTFLNALNQQVPGGLNLEGEYFPTSDGSGCHLPEDYLMRGQIWSSSYHPHGFFDQPSVDDDERSLELPSMAIPRAERCLWIAHRLALVSVDRWFRFDKQENKFQVTKSALDLERLCEHRTVFTPVAKKRPDISRKHDIMIVDAEDIIYTV